MVNHSVVRQELHGHCDLQGEVDLPLVGHRLWGGEGRGGECGRIKAIVSNDIHVAI